MSHARRVEAVAKIAAVGVIWLVGAILGLLAAAASYQAWWPEPPCGDHFEPPGVVFACMVPTAPGWLLVAGAVLGALVAGLIVVRVQRVLSARA